jgi:hypothetical protein
MAEASQVRVFGRGAIRPTAPGSSPARRRVYRPRGERVSSAAKAAVAAARPRDARGHFLPSAGGRDRAVVPVAVAELVWDGDTVLADLASVSGVVRPAARKGRGQPKAGESMALSGADVA